MENSGNFLEINYFDAFLFIEDKVYALSQKIVQKMFIVTAILVVEQSIFCQGIVVIELCQSLDLLRL